MRDFYVISVTHTNREHQYITVWRPENKGYAWPLSWAGKYSEADIKEHPDYYHSGCSNIAVPCSLLDGMAVPPTPRTIDNDAGPVVLNTKENWKRILAALPWPPQHQPKPQYKGARRQKGAA